MNPGHRRVPSRYEDDPRVQPREGGGYTATEAGKTFNILYTDTDRWTICLAPAVTPMPIANGCYARFLETPAQAIAFAIGAPIAARVAA